MNKFKPRNKICFQNKTNPRANLKLYKYKSKKWNILRKQLRYRKEIKPENRKKFYQQRLLAKQQFQYFYQIKYYQLKNLLNFFKKKKTSQNSFKNFRITLESRLDITLVRLNLAQTIFHARQLISHNKIKVNKQIVNKKNIFLKKGDFILRKYGSKKTYKQTKLYKKDKQEVLSKKKLRKKIFFDKFKKLQEQRQKRFSKKNYS